MTASQALAIMRDTEKAVRYGWHITIDRSANGFITDAHRVAVGGRCGAPTEHDSGYTVVRAELNDALAHLLQVIVLETENATEAERVVHRRFAEP